MDSTLLILPIAAIDEDPNQPRTVFDESSLQELAATIQERGIKTPISVRPHPELPGRYLINHGARRFRASILAGKDTVPAHVDEEYTEADQLVENVQRENLSPREVAEFIGKLLARGRKKGEIAKIIGKSPAYVTQHVNLLDLPASVAEAFQIGRCNDVTVINELARLEKLYPEQTELWLADKMQDINRNTLKTFRDFIDATKPEQQFRTRNKTAPSQKIQAGSDKLARPALWGELHGRKVKLLLHRVPSSPGMAWFHDEEGQAVEARLSVVCFVTLCENAD